MGKRGMKTDDRTKEKIRACYATCGNMRKTARDCGVATSTVKKIVEEEPDSFERLRTEKKKEMIDEIWLDMTAALKLGRQKINLASIAIEDFEPTINKLVELLEGREETNGKDVIELIRALSSITSIPLSHISTYFGTLYDKQALMSGENTHKVELKATDLSEEEAERIIKEFIP